MPGFTVPLQAAGKESGHLVGGKAANLGELLRLGIPVPDGFCLTTRAFRRFLESSEEAEKFFVRLEQVDADDRGAVEAVARDLAVHLGDLPVPADVRDDLLAAWRRAGPDRSWAVRSSATAEDLVGASFAGQHDTFLNVRGEEQLLEAVRACWISLFSERAVGYRIRHGFDHRQVELAVVVQEMVTPTVSGVMFTADPVGGDRRTVMINAAFGLGEAIVSGLANPDLYRVGPDGTVETVIADKALAVEPTAGGGVERRAVPEELRSAQALADADIRRLARIGRRLEEHFTLPQDVEWTWSEEGFRIVQSRPITTLYPLPDPTDDGRLHVYFSLGHQQMMTDAMKPLALSVIRNYFPFGGRGRDGETTAQVAAGNRLFIDYTDLLHTRIGRMLFAYPAGTMDERMSAAFLEVARRPEFAVNHRFRPARVAKVNFHVLRTLLQIVADVGWRDPRTAEPRNRAFIEREAAATRAAFRSPGGDVIGRIQTDMRKSMEVYYRLTTTQFSAAVTRTLLRRLGDRWLADSSPIAALDKSLPGNVTTEMSLEIADLADLLREYPGLVRLLESPPQPFTPDALDAEPGGAEFRAALESFLERHGTRCPGELDITRERWGERPELLFAGLVANVRGGRPGEHRERFTAGEREAQEAARQVLDGVRTGPGGRAKAALMSRLIDVYRAMMGMREHQKFLTVQLYGVYRAAILAEAERLVRAGMLGSVEDVEYLTLYELRRLARGRVPAGLAGLIADRRAEYEACRSLTAPRLMTSEGEILVGLRPRPEGDGALTGLPVSAGVVEGRARVVLRPDDADLRGDDAILVAPFTDPAWTPLFSAVRGMVVEVGGLMTHGAVVARELGLPAVVGVDGATRTIPDGARIRVDGSQGVVEILERP